MTDMPIVETYREVGIHDFQISERIEQVVKPAIDFVFDLDDPDALFKYALSPANPPEARGLAEIRVTVLAEDRASRGRAAHIDLQMLRAGTAGIDSHWADKEFYCSLFEAIHQPGQAAPRPNELGERMTQYFSEAGRDEAIARGWKPPVLAG